MSSASHYAKAVADLDEHDLSMLAAWHASLEVGQPIANKEFLVNVFPSLGDNRREALKIAAGFRGEEAFEAGVAEEQALEHGAALALARALPGARRGVHRALLLGPARLRQLVRGARPPRARRRSSRDRLRGVAKPHGASSRAPAPRRS